MSLKFLHPHIETYVFDESEVVEIATGGGTNLFMPFFSSKGTDNTVMVLESLPGTLKEFGSPNMKFYGQSYYQVIQWLTGGGTVYGMRLTPSNAYFANTMLNVKTKPIQTQAYERDGDGNFLKDENSQRIPLLDNLGDPVLVPGIDVKLAVESVSQLGTKTDLKGRMESLDEMDADGYKNHYLTMFVSKGKGKYGNKLSYNLVPNSNYEEDYDFRIYTVSLFEKDDFGNVNNLEVPYLVSTYPEAKNISNVMFGIKEILSSYSGQFDVEFNDLAYDRLLEDIDNATKVAGESVFANLRTIDFLFGYDKEGELYENIVMNPDSTAIDAFEGILFAGGSDGSLDTSIPLTSRMLTMEALLLEVYTGVKDSKLLDDQIYPLELSMDANHSVAIKNTICNFVRMREDHMGIVDTNIQANPAAVLAWRKSQFQENDYLTAIFGMHSTTYDPYTSKDMTVTQMYDLAYRIPFSDARYGMHMPFVGPKRGILNNFKTLCWNPTTLEKEELYKARVNYIETDNVNSRYMSQLTSQKKTSALSNINNVRTLLKAKRLVKSICKEFFFEYPTPDTINTMNSSINRELYQFIDSGACSSMNCAVYQEAYDKIMKTLRVKISVTFNNVIERIIITFNIGR